FLEVVQRERITFRRRQIGVFHVRENSALIGRALADDMNRVQCICRTETHELRRPFGFVEPSRRQETDAHPNERRRDLLHDGRAERVGDRRIRGRIVCCHGCSYPLKAKYAMTDAAMASGTAEARGSGSITSMLEVCFCARSS